MPPSSSDRLNQIGNEYFGRGLYTEAYDYYQQALACDRQSGDRRALVATLGNLGNVCAVSGRREQAQQYYQEVLELQKVLGDERGIGTTLANLGNLRTDAGEWGRAQAYYLEALDLLTRAGDDAALAVLSANLGLVARETGDYEQALAHDERSLTLMRRLGNQAGVADAYRMIGKTYVLRRGDRDAGVAALVIMAGVQYLSTRKPDAGVRTPLSPQARAYLRSIRDVAENSLAQVEAMLAAVDRSVRRTGEVADTLDHGIRRLEIWQRQFVALSPPQAFQNQHHEVGRLLTELMSLAHAIRSSQTIEPSHPVRRRLTVVHDRLEQMLNTVDEL